MVIKTWQLIIIVAALLVAATINGGIYQIIPAGTTVSAQLTTGYRINRFTGTTWQISENGVMRKVTCLDADNETP